jgi:hypothetical protein
MPRSSLNALSFISDVSSSSLAGRRALPDTDENHLATTMRSLHGAAFAQLLLRCLAALLNTSCASIRGIPNFPAYRTIDCELSVLICTIRKIGAKVLFYHLSTLTTFLRSSSFFNHLNSARHRITAPHPSFQRSLFLHLGAMYYKVNCFIQR